MGGVSDRLCVRRRSHALALAGSRATITSYRAAAGRRAYRRLVWELGGCYLALERLAPPLFVHWPYGHDQVNSAVNRLVELGYLQGDLLPPPVAPDPAWNSHEGAMRGSWKAAESYRYSVEVSQQPMPSWTINAAAFQQAAEASQSANERLERTTPNPSPESANAPAVPDSMPPAPMPSLLSASDLDRQVGQDARSVEPFLRRLAKKNPACRTRVENPRRGEARYMYRTEMVWRELKTKYNSAD